MLHFNSNVFNFDGDKKIENLLLNSPFILTEGRGSEGKLGKQVANFGTVIEFWRQRKE